MFDCRFVGSGGFLDEHQTSSTDFRVRGPISQFELGLENPFEFQETSDCWPCVFKGVPFTQGNRGSVDY